MSPQPSHARRGAPTAVVALVLAVTSATAAWWLHRRVTEARLTDAVEALATPASLDPTSPVNDALADLGAELFRGRCSACHAISGGARIGPDLAGITRRQTLPWIEAMLLRPDSMTRADPYARALREAYDVQMKIPGGPFGPAHARAVIAFLRRADGG